MKDQLIKAINIYSELYPDYQIESVYLLHFNEDTCKYKVNGIKGNSELSDIFVVTL